MKTLIKKFGKIDILLNAAGGNMPGATIGENQNIFDLSLEEFSKVTELNLNGSVIPSLIFGKVMAKQKSGVIINYSSMSTDRVISRVVGYSASKAALIVLTKCWALEYAKDKIRVNCICPGVVDTDMTKPFLKNQKDIEFMNNEHPLGRIGKPDEIGKAALYFTSDDASWVTGAVLTIDGGESIK